MIAQSGKARARSELRPQFQWWVKRGAGMVFDSLHGVDTRVGVPAGRLEISSVNREKGIAYDSCPWSTLRRSLRLASVRPEGFTFVDIGCGKGKVLLSAIVLPFERVVGVEFSAYLSRVAAKNIAEARLWRRRCSSAQIICCDAIKYEIPEQPLIFFFNNPFRSEIMEIVIGNIITSYLRNIRPIFLLFFRTSSIIPQISQCLQEKSRGRSHWLVSNTLGGKSINIFELPAN